MAPQFTAPIGTRDLLPPESGRHRLFVERFADLAATAGYGEIATPMFEDLEVFKRVGEATEVVTKEMYDFSDKGGRRIALRPELTASVCRAFAEHRPAVSPWKVWYSGSQFRYEKPQRGRYRQFEQVGVEALGADDPDLDVEVITLASDFFRGLGLTAITLLVNSLGDGDDRVRYTTALAGYLDRHRADLSQEACATLLRNPLRVLDSKRPQDAAVVAAAPTIAQFWSRSSARHFDRVQAGLRAAGIGFEIQPRLVRGLDYYCRTTFEFASGALDSAQNAVGGGGRYDGLVASLGGPPTPGIGFALGVDRTLLACDAEGVFEAPPSGVSVFVVDTTDGSHARDLVSELRRAGLSADRAWSTFAGGLDDAGGVDEAGGGWTPRSMKAQMKAADRSGAGIALIVGEDEAEGDVVLVRPLRSGATQHRVPRDGAVAVVVAMASAEDVGG